jgi:hypothetical protein
MHNAIGRKGWIDRSTSLQDAIVSIEKGRIRASRFNANVEKYDHNELIIGDFEWIITTLQSKGITPVLITCPNYQTVRNSLDKVVLDKTQSAINFLSEKYNVLYLNYFEGDGFDVPDYYDCDHLNTSGADKLTSMIDSVIMKMEIKNSNQP